VTVAARKREVDRVMARCHAGLDLTTLRGEVMAGLRTLMPIDAMFWATVDPATLLFTTVSTEAPLDTATPLFLANEYGQDDVNKFAALAASADDVRSLDQATHGDRRTSRRYVEVMAPMQLGDELRAALTSARRCWGVLCLHRTNRPSGFTAEEIALVRRLAPHIAAGLRRALLVAGRTPPRPGTRGPGVIVLSDEMAVTFINAEAERWIAELRDPAWIDIGTGSMPAAVFAAAATARVGPSDTAEPRVRLRSVDGQWITVHASRLTGSTGNQTAVVLEAARPAEVASVHLDVLGLTPAQARVAGLVLQGRSTHEITSELHISSHTVQEHLRAVFDKLGVASRRELVATLLGPHHRTIHQPTRSRRRWRFVSVKP
jgi:DNA-binding CsgD family transcriptional regulator